MGVLVDDLVTKGTDCEPYRMFTSRAEYRLLLREDNADLRLTEIGYSIGLATAESHQRVVKKKQLMTELFELLEKKQITPTASVNSTLASFGSAPLRNQVSLAQVLRRPELSFSQLRLIAEDMPRFPYDVEAQAEIQIKYDGYVGRQLEIVKRFKKMEHLRLPEDIDYSQVNGLSREAREKLSTIRPRSLGQASRISGITPAAISLLSVYVRKKTTAS
jgi:tRNA uridine 5-carboxymethylaminomethyl modification enzyme